MKKMMKWIVPMAAGTTGALLAFAQIGLAAQANTTEQGAPAVQITAESVTDLNVESRQETGTAVSGSETIDDNQKMQKPDLTTAVSIRISDESILVEYQGEELENNEWKELGISFKKGILSIEQAGTYILSGTLSGSIEVSTSKSETVNLVLDGLAVTSEEQAALSVKKTGTLEIYLEDGTENILTSGVATEIDEESADKAQDASGGVLYSKAETIIGGSGSLTVSGYINNGIQVTKSLTIGSGNVSITALNNGIKVKDTYIQDAGDVTILSGNDGIKAQQQEQEASEEVVDENTGEVLQEAQEEEEAAGQVVINGGSLTIDSYGDAVQAYLDLVINGGDLNLKTEGEYAQKGESRGFGAGDSRTGRNRGESDAATQFDVENPSETQVRTDTENASSEVRMPEAAEDAPSPEAFKIDNVSSAPQSKEEESKSGWQIAPAAPQQQADGQFPTDRKVPAMNQDWNKQDVRDEDSASDSTKGLKSDGTLTINGGTITIDSIDDGLHSADLLTVNNGTITISTGDDGIHSDKEVIIYDGSIDITKSYEGIEANQITIYGGDISVVSSDDGVNANGGPQSFGGPSGSRGTQAESTSTDMPNLNIYGGNIYVNASGDGLDSNGNITIAGGFTVVDGPQDNGNGALDAGAENGGKILVSGGLVFAGGASGMAETFESTSEQVSFKCTLPSTYTAGTKIRVSGSDGREYFSYEAASSGNCVVFSCPELALGDTCILTVGDISYEITLSSNSTQVIASQDGTTQEGAIRGSFGNMGGADQNRPGDSNGGRKNRDINGQGNEGQDAAPDMAP